MTLPGTGPGPGGAPVLPADVTSTLAALVPHDALRNVFGAPGRGAGVLAWRRVLLDEPTAAELLGAPVPDLPVLGEHGAVPHLSVRRGLPTEPLRDQLAAGLLPLHLQRAHLAPGQRWETALLWPVLRRGGSVLDVVVQDPRRPWPEPLPARVSSRHDTGTGDHAVVTVGGTDVGVQVDRSGVVHLTWLLHRGGSVLRMRLLTRRGPRATVELVVAGGLLAE